MSEVKLSDMSYRGTLQNSASTASGLGTKDSYANVTGLTNIYGKLRKLSGNGFDNFGISGGKTSDYGELVFNARWEFITRYQASLESSLNKSSRWVIDGEQYHIESWERISGKKFYLRFILRNRQ